VCHVGDDEPRHPDLGEGAVLADVKALPPEAPRGCRLLAPCAARAALQLEGAARMRATRCLRSPVPLQRKPAVQHAPYACHSTRRPTPLSPPARTTSL
jgi:hypothetical protein